MIVRALHEVIDLPCCVIVSSSAQHSGRKHRGRVAQLLFCSSWCTVAPPVLQALDTSLSLILHTYSVTRRCQFYAPNISVIQALSLSLKCYQVCFYSLPPGLLFSSFLSLPVEWKFTFFSLLCTLQPARALYDGDQVL